MIFKKIPIALALFILTAVPLRTNAASLTLAPEHISVQKGDTFSLILGVDTTGTMAYTVKAETSFTPKTLQFSGWEFNPNWIPLHQKGYDSLDPNKGIFIRTGGYPNGFKNSTNFGTVTFKATEVGKAVITISPNSLIYNEVSENTFTGGNKVIVEVVPVIVKKEQENKTLETKNGIPTNKTTPSETHVPISQEQKFESEEQISTLQQQNFTSGEKNQETLKPTAEKVAPTLFDISAEIASQKESNLIFYYLIALAIVGVVTGLAFVILLERFRRRRIFENKNKINHGANPLKKSRKAKKTPLKRQKLKLKDYKNKPQKI